MTRCFHLFFFSLYLIFRSNKAQFAEVLKDRTDLVDRTGVEELEDGDFTRDILVIPNRFPKQLNWFCEPRNDLMKDRLCYGQLDAFAIACADDEPPLQLVPFCLAFKHQCSKTIYPAEGFCQKEFSHYKGFCLRERKMKCKSCYYDVTCTCEPYECLWRRYGFETARWCQRYELFCNEKKRRNKANRLVSIMEDAIKVHFRCMHMFNLPEVICDPFKRKFDWQRCMKFLFDCELISEWDDEKEEKSNNEASESKQILPEQITVKAGLIEMKKVEEIPMGVRIEGNGTVTAPGKKLTVEEEEKILEQLIREAEEDERRKKIAATLNMTKPPDPFISNMNPMSSPFRIPTIERPPLPSNKPSQSKKNPFSTLTLKNTNL